MKLKVKDKVEFYFYYENKIGTITHVDEVHNVIEILGTNNNIYKVKSEKILNKIV